MTNERSRGRGTGGAPKFTKTTKLVIANGYALRDIEYPVVEKGGSLAKQPVCTVLLHILVIC
jgi:hypothetical protein